MDQFLATNTFVRDLNAEGPLANETSKKSRGGGGLGHIENLVAVQFDADRKSHNGSKSR